MGTMVIPKPVIAACAALIVGAWSAAASADSFRCGTRLLTDGDSMDKVEALCGAPSSIQRHEILARRVRWFRGRPYYTSFDPEPIPVEFWTYNLGSRRLMRRLKFEDGLLVDVETLEHGYDPPLDSTREY